MSSITRRETGLDIVIEMSNALIDYLRVLLLIVSPPTCTTLADHDK
jgi:hypothetical protein